MEGAHKSILHAESAGTSFHKVLHSLSEQSPILGNALRAALNPITGILLGTIAAFQYFTKVQKEAADQADKLGEAEAKAQVGMIEAGFADNPQKGRRKLALENAKKEAEKSVGEFLPEAEQNITKGLTAGQKLRWVSPGFDEAKMAEAVRLQ